LICWDDTTPKPSTFAVIFYCGVVKYYAPGEAMSPSFRLVDELSTFSFVHQTGKGKKKQNI